MAEKRTPSEEPTRDHRAPGPDAPRAATGTAETPRRSSDAGVGDGIPASDPAGQPTAGEPMVETPIQAKMQTAREPGLDRVDPADRGRGLPRLQGARLSPSLLLVLVAVTLAIIATIVIYGGLV